MFKDLLLPPILIIRSTVTQCNLARERTGPIWRKELYCRGITEASVLTALRKYESFLVRELCLRIQNTQFK